MHSEYALTRLDAPNGLTATDNDTDRRITSVVARQSGGARRDRTDDLLLAKQALSQLSYGPFRVQKSEVSKQKNKPSEY